MKNERDVRVGGVGLLVIDVIVAIAGASGAGFSTLILGLIVFFTASGVICLVKPSWGSYLLEALERMGENADRDSSQHMSRSKGVQAQNIKARDVTIINKGSDSEEDD